MTETERQVLALVARGFVNREIGEKLCVSTSTVKSYLHDACRKLKARNRAQAVILSFNRGLLDLKDVFSLSELAELLVSLDPQDVNTIIEMILTRRQELQPSLPPEWIRRLP